MNKLLLLAFTALLTVSCVSKKKYAEMEAEMERMKTLESVNTSLQSRLEASEREQENQMKELMRQLEEAHRMVKEKDMELHAKGAASLSQEEREQVELERRRRHEVEMLELHRNPVNNEFEAALAKGESEARILKSTLEGALKDYSSSKVTVEKLGSRVVVSVQDNVLFLNNGEQVSAGGETFLNRFSTALKVRNSLNMSIVGIAGNEGKEARANALKKAGTLTERLVATPEVAAKTPLTGVKDCKHSFSERTTGCDRVEFVFEPDYEAIIGTMRMTER